MSAPAIRRLIVSLRTRYHLWSGHRAYKSGRMRLAGRHFREAVKAGAHTFEAWLILGKIYYRQNDLARAADAFDRAAKTDPIRFELEGYPDNFVPRLAARSRTAPRPEYRVVIESGEGEDPRRARHPAYGDFRTRDEWLAHRTNPAIQPGDGQHVDWDEAAKDLFAE